MNTTLKGYLPVLLVSFGLAVGFTAASLSPSPPTSSLNIYQTAQNQTVLVDTPSGQGSAVMVKRTNNEGKVRWFAWTAQHVTEGYSEVKIKVILRTESRKVGEVIFTAKVLGTSPETDCALLFVDAPETAFTAALFASDTPALPGDPVFACGNFRGISFDGSISTGVIAQIGVRPPFVGWPWKLLDQSTSPAYPGSSGGPVFNARGQVLGIVVGGVDATLNFFVPVRALSEWAASAKFSWAIRGDDCPADKDLKSKPVVVVAAPAPAPAPAPTPDPGCSN